MNFIDNFCDEHTSGRIRKLGFDVECIAIYNQNGKFEFLKLPRKNSELRQGDYISAPMIQQVLDWLVGQGITTQIIVSHDLNTMREIMLQEINELAYKERNG